MKKSFVSLTSDFGVQSQGVGIMEAVIRNIAPDAHVVHLIHGLPDYDIRSAAWALEATVYLPVGYHCCVVDPGVGTDRKPLIIKTKRGDYLIGPDNGVLLPAARMLGGCEKVVGISNQKYMLLPISPIFHGRHIFAPTAGHLASGVPIEEFGAALRFEELVPAPYGEAVWDGEKIAAEVIFINKYGSPRFNILSVEWDKLSLKKQQSVMLRFSNKEIVSPFVETYGDVPAGAPLILKDDYGRVEAAINVGDFAKKYGIKVGDKCVIRK